jgi:hypothetical protein
MEMQTGSTNNHISQIFFVQHQCIGGIGYNGLRPCGASFLNLSPCSLGTNNGAGFQP